MGRIHQLNNVWRSNLDNNEKAPEKVTDNIAIPVGTGGILKATSALRTSSTAVFDGIPPFIFKGIAELIIPNYSSWPYNVSLISAVFPKVFESCFPFN